MATPFEAGCVRVLCWLMRTYSLGARLVKVVEVVVRVVRWL